MKKNIDKWNFYKDIIDEKTRIFLQPFIEKVPQKFYKLSGHSVVECTLIDLSYSFEFRIPYWSKKPSKEDVAEIARLSGLDINFDVKRIFVNHSYQWSSGQVAKTAVKLEDVYSDYESVKTIADELKRENDERKSYIELHKKDKGYDYNQNGYSFLGWQNGWKHRYFDEKGEVTEDHSKAKSFGYLTSDYPEYGKCRDLKHITIEVQHNQRGSENTVSCPICMIYWKYDCSD